MDNDDSRDPARAPGRIFIVGCPRSGTTFLQHALARHPQVLSLPETGFFDQILNQSGNWLARRELRDSSNWLGLARGRTHRSAPRLLRSLAQELGLPPESSRPHWSLQGYIDRFVALLDAGARHHGRHVWIEKSPIHVAYVDLIAERVPDAKFIHVLRNGEDVLASVIDAGLQYACCEKASGFDRWIPYWVSFWNRAMCAHLNYLEQEAGRERHCFVCHEDLVDQFASESRR